jgi:hypothetical protein
VWALSGGFESAGWQTLYTSYIEMPSHVCNHAEGQP